MKKVQLLLSALLLVSLVTACAPATAPAPTPPPPPLPPAPVPAVAPQAARATATVSPARPAWQEKWEAVLAAAKSEGRILVHVDAGGAVVRAIMDIAKMQGVEAEVLSMRSAEFYPKTLAERRAGIYNFDIYFGGPSTMLSQFKTAGMMQPIEPALILPDVTDPAIIKTVWYKGELPWVDRDRTSMATTITAQTPIAVNTDLVKEGEKKSWRDLLNPKWKGKIVVNDPSVSGSGQMGLACVDQIMGWDYVKELVKTEPIVLRDQRLQLEWLAHGKVPILVTPKPDTLRDFLKLGAPMKAIAPSEGTWVSAGASGLGFFSREAHPNAARVFINSLLSKEGQNLFAPAFGFQSAREDASTAHLRPEDIRQAGAKYFNGYSEEFSVGARREEVNKLLKELFGPMAK